jgi:hypothetical protein
MDTVEDFFAEVAGKEHEPFLRRISGTVRFDLTNGFRKGSPNGSHGGSHTGGNSADHWTIAIDRGDLSVSHRSGKADTVIRTDRKLFERIITGHANAMASMLRGLVFVEGDPELGALACRLFATTAMRGPRHV